MMLRLTIAGTLALGPAVAFAQTSIAPHPRNDRSTWVTRGDYPIEEYARGAQGTTAFVVTVGADGKPKSCEIIQSSGSAVLDNKVCTLVTTRAKFSPARDATGRKIEGRYSNRVHWLIPPEQAAEMAQVEQQASPQK